MTSSSTDAVFSHTEKLQHDLHTLGYTVLRDYITPTQIQSLLASARKLTSAARVGRWPHLRTLPKQFPPWTSNATDGIWGVQHLLHPDLSTGSDPVLTPSEAAVFKHLYFGDALTTPIKSILELPHDPSSDNELIMELFNMLVSPPAPFSLRWHRDDVPFSLSTDEEAAALGLLQYSQSVAPEESGHIHGTNGTNGTNGTSTYSATSRAHNPFSQREESAYIIHPALRRPTHTQYNIPLLPDSSLHVVPGSHLRPRTPQELALLARDPYTDALPGWTAVPLQPGDVVFYNNNLIHRGVYDGADTAERYTLHGSVGRVDDHGGAGVRARNVLQHGVREWIARVDVSGLGDVSRRDDESRAGATGGPVLASELTTTVPRSLVPGDAANGRTAEDSGADTRRQRSMDVDVGGDERVVRRAEGMRDRLLDLGRRSGEVGFAHID